MRGKMSAFAILQILLLQAMPVLSGEYCTYAYSLFDESTRYCDGGCCGSKYSTYSDVCCYVRSSYISGGVIAGAVVGGLVGLGIVIAIIVCCCCACRRSGHSPGAIVQPMNTGSPAIVMNSTTSVAQGMPMPPGPAYGQSPYVNGAFPAGLVPLENMPQEHPPAYAAKY